jgi:acetylornithine/succinyldiaminopimelate/putrescine aminotransferase
MLRQQLAGLIAAHPAVFEEVRGQGLMLGLKMRVPNTDSSPRCAQPACSRSAPATMSCACCRR